MTTKKIESDDADVSAEYAFAGAPRGKHHERALHGVTLPAGTGPEWLEALHPVVSGLAPVRPRLGSPVVWVADLTFPRWTGGDPKELPWAVTYGKQGNVVADDGAALSFAEVEVTKRLRAAGWDGGWLDTYGRAPLRWKPWIVTLAELPPLVRRRFFAIHNPAVRQTRTGTSGQPDVIAWRNGTVAFLEVKGPGDRASDAQEAWARSAVEADRDAYGLLRWTIGYDAGR